MELMISEDEGTSRIFSSLRSLSGLSVEIGLPEGASPRSRFLLALHEHGAPGANIPPRRVLGPALADARTRGEIEAGLLQACEAAARGDENGVTTGFEQAGQAGANGIRAYIDAGVSPPNSPVTVHGGWIRRKGMRAGYPVPGKGFDKPLVDTGELYRSFTYRIIP